MNIEVTHFVCRRCEVNGQWMCDTPVGLMRLYFVHSGEGSVYNCRKTHILKPGKLYLFTQYGDFHTVDSKHFDHSFFNFHANYAVMPECFFEFDRSDFSFVNFEELSEMLQDKEKYENTLRALLTTLLSYIDESICLPIISNSIVLRAIGIIQQQLIQQQYKDLQDEDLQDEDLQDEQSETISTSALASELNINESHFIRIFKKQMGVTPMQYIRSCRIAKGIALMQSGMNITSASEECGYSSPAAFSNAFRNETGVLPSHYLKRNEE